MLTDGGRDNGRADVLEDPPVKMIRMLGIVLLAHAATFGAVRTEGPTDLTIDAQPRTIEPAGRAATITLDGGDTLRGDITRDTPQAITLRHDDLGSMTIQREIIASIVYEDALPVPNEVVPPPVSLPAPTDAGPIDPPADTAEAAPEPDPEPKAEWKFRLDFGVDGAQGNTDRASGRAALAITRKLGGHTLRFNTNYYVAEQNSRRTADRLRAFGRSEWLLDDSRWDIFIQGETDIDDFQPYDWRLTANSGIAYRVIETDETKLKARVGPGFSYTAGVPDTEIEPEFVAGVELSHELSERQRLASFAEYLPNAKEFSDFRLRIGGSWEIDLTEDRAMVLKLGVEDRYDSMPGTAKSNALDYFATIGWRF